MDERHWWITTKLQQSFQSVVNEKDFLAQKIEQFISSEETISLLDDFFTSTQSKIVLFALTSLDPIIIRIFQYGASNEEQFKQDRKYNFIIKTTNEDVTTENFRNVLYFGEVHEETLPLYCDLLRNAINLFSDNTTYDKNISKSNFLAEANSNLQNLVELKNSMAMNSQILKIPKDSSFLDFKKCRITNIPSHVISEHEEIVNEWIYNIEDILKDSLDERLDVHSGLIPMLTEWKERLKKTRAIMDQLKTKECKSVLALLVAGKSKVIKNWKSVDALLTDFSNDVKEKVKYLESFGKRFEDLQVRSDISILNSQVIPEFVNHVKQVDALSKLYAKNGFLGSLFNKISYQIVAHCFNNISTTITDAKKSYGESVNIIWKLISNENLKSVSSFVSIKKSLECGDLPSYSLTGTLFNSLLLCKHFEELYFELIESFGGKNNIQYNPQLSGVYVLIKRFQVENHREHQNKTTSLDEKQTKAGDNNENQLEQSDGILRTVYGMAFTDVDNILSYSKTFATRIKQIINMIETLKQFVDLIQSTKGLPQLLSEKWAANCRQESDDQYSIEMNSDDDSDVSDSDDDLLEVHESLSKKLHDIVKSVKFFLRESLTFDVVMNTDDDEEFKAVMLKYLPYIERLQFTVTHYIKTIFAMKWSTQQQIDILRRFECVYSCTSLKNLFEEKYTHVIHCLEQDLENVEQLYETNKDNPPKYRDLPIVSCALQWSHGLYERINKPMHYLKSVKLAHQIKRYDSVLKHYNKIATTLNKFKEKWVLAWNSQVIHCRTFLDVTLLAQDIESKRIIVYSDPRVLEIFSDAKTMLKLGLPLPKSVSELCLQESKFRHYKQRLEDVVSLFYSVYEVLPDVIQQCISRSINSTLKAFQPALSILKWNSLNVDVFLFKLEKSVGKFKEIIVNIQDKLRLQVKPLITEIENVSMFDEGLNGIWNKDDFLQRLQHNCNDVQNKFDVFFGKIEDALKSIEDITYPKEKKKSARMSLFDNNSSGRSASHIKQETRKLDAPDIQAERLEIFKNLLDYYREDIYEAVKKSFLKGFLAFHKTLKAKGDLQLKFNISTRLQIPNIRFEPTFDEIDQILKCCVQMLTDIGKSCYWYKEGKKYFFHDELLAEADLKQLSCRILSSNIDTLCLTERKLLAFESFSFLWRDDMNSTWKIFQESHPGLFDHHKEVSKIVDIENKLENIPDNMNINIVCVNNKPVKYALAGFCSSWKYCFVQKIHESLQARLLDIVQQRDEYLAHLHCEIDSLVDLEKVLEEIENINNMNNHIDNIYLPIETEFNKLLNDYQIQLTRKEVNDVESLRDKWSELVLLGDKVSQIIMGEKRVIFEQKLDKEVKGFVIEVIQFRNDFDSKGPSVPGVTPNEAVTLLKEFQEKYNLFDEKRKTLHSVQKILGISATPFVELTKTGKELVLLAQLYETFQQYIDLDKKFRETLWADVNLDKYFSQINQLWNNCLNLPTEVQSWYAYKDLHERLNSYLQVFPLLEKLASKEIRNRHWLQVMQVAKRSFQLEANIFRLKDILDISLVSFKTEIEHILENSREELTLETKLRKIEEDWCEQSFIFESYKGRGNVLFDKKALSEILDVLEDAKMVISTMLSSKHVRPFHEEAAAWAVKLNDVSEIIILWKAVEQLWMHLESIFTSNAVAKDLPQQFAMFSKADRSYMKLVKKTSENPNITQCCLGGDVSKIVILKDIQKDLEICFNSLASFLDQKRRVFPRLNFIPNKVLLSILSRPFDVAEITPFIKDMIPSVHRMETQSDELDVFEKPPSSVGFNQARRRTSYVHAPDMTRDRLSVSMGSSNGRDSSSRTSRIGSIINQNFFLENTWTPKDPKKSILAVVDEFGEKVNFPKQIPITNCIEEWLGCVLRDIKLTISKEMMSATENNPDGISIDDVMMKKCSQICFMTFFYIWSSQSEKAIVDIRVDRKSFANMNKKFVTITSRLINILNRNTWRSTNVRLSNVQKIRIEATIGNALYLRDLFEDLLQTRKVRDIHDFEWKQTLKCTKSKTDATSLQISVLDKTFDYQNEFMGAKNSFIMSPPTDRCIVHLLLALSQKRGGCITGDNLSGKSQTVKGISYLLGQYLFTWDCKLMISRQSMLQIFSGLCEEGCFVCFDDIQFLSKEMLSQFHYYIKVISQALVLKESFIQMNPSHKVNLDSSCAIFITTNPTFITKDCPVYIKENFRITHLMMPDIAVIMRSQLIISGFKCPKELSQHMKMLIDVCKNQIQKTNFSLSILKNVISRASLLLSKNDSPVIPPIEITKPRLASASSSVGTFSQTVSRNGRQERLSVVPQTPYADIFKSESLILIQAFQDIIGCRLSDEDSVVLNLSLCSIFGVELNENSDTDLSSVIGNITQENNLSPHQNFVNKVAQLYQLSQTHHGIVICGGSKCGKSTVMKILIETLRILADRNNASISYRMEHLNVLAVATLNSMFGYVDKEGSWNDGVFTSLIKKANQQQGNHKTSTWICLDGPLHEDWCSQLYSLVDETKIHVEVDLHRFHLSENVKILFETETLNHASPDIIGKMGVLYVDTSTVGWRALADSWLADRPTSQRNVLQRAFYRSMDKIVHFVQDEAQMVVGLSECALFTSCLNLLSALFKEHSELGGDTHVERLFIFSLIWCVGGLLRNETDRNHFNTLMLSLTNVLPDDDSKINVFDYYVDESGEWDSWGNKLCEVETLESNELFGNIFVETITSVQLKFLMHLLTSASFNVLLIGDRVSGKTSLMETVINKKGSKKQISKHWSFSKTTTFASLYQLLDKCLVHRRGFVYGGKNNKSLKLFLDDINVPDNDICGRQSVIELLSQIMDRRIIYSMVKGQQVKFIEDLSISATISTPSLKKAQELSRLLGNFCLLFLPNPNLKDVNTIVSETLEACMTMKQGLSLPEALHQQIVNSSVYLCTKMVAAFNNHDSTGCIYHLGSLRDVFNMMQRCPEESRVDENYLLLFCVHEMKRFFGDRINDHAGVDWFNQVVIETVQKQFKWGNLPEEPLFITFSLVTHTRSQRQSKQTPKSMIGHGKINTLLDTKKCFESYIEKFSHEKNTDLHIELHEHNLYMLVKFHHTLSQEYRANTIVVSTENEIVNKVIQLVSYMYQYPVYYMNPVKYLQDLRSAVRYAGCDNKHVVVVVQADIMIQTNIYDAINSLISIGEYDPLFNETEFHGLVMTVMPLIKKKYPTYRNDPKGFFTSCIKKFLHFVIVSSPHNQFLQNLSSNYHGISGCSYMIYNIDSTDSQLHNQAHALLRTRSFQETFTDDRRELLVDVMVQIHYYCQIESTNQLFGRDQSNGEEDLSKPSTVLEIKMAGLSRFNRKMSPNFDCKVFLKFVTVFCRIFESKMEMLTTKCHKRRIALDYLLKARSEIEDMEKQKFFINKQYEDLSKEVLELNKMLFMKSSLIERLKAKLNVGTGSFKAFMSMIENEIMEPDIESVCVQEEQDELDMEYERLQSSMTGIKTLDEQIEEAKQLLARLEQEMNFAKESLLSFQVKIDRGCIERLRAYQSPPALVGTVMVMVMILMGRSEFSNFVVSSGRREKHTSGDIINLHGSSHSRTSSAKSKRTPKSGTSVSIVTDGKVDRHLWKTVQQIMQDSQKFCENMNTHNWCEGVSDDVLYTVVSMFAKGEEVPLTKREIPVSSAKPDSSQHGISLQAAKYSSEDAAQMVEYVQCVVHFTKKYRPYKMAMRRLKSLEDEKLIREEELQDLKKPDENVFQEPEEEVDVLAGLDEKSLLLMEKELKSLQERYDSVCINKFNMEKNLDEFTVLLDSSHLLLTSLKEMELSWTEHANEEKMKSTTLFDSIVGAAFLQYSGPFNIDKRNEMMTKFIEICQCLNGSDIVKSSCKSIMSFLHGQKETNINVLSNVCNDNVALDLMSLTMSHNFLCDWPLMFDPHGVGVYLLKKVIPDVQVISEEQFANEIETALQNGCSVIVTNVTCKSMFENTKLQSVLKNHDMFIESTSSFKLMIGEKEVDCSPSFRMILATSDDPNEMMHASLNINPVYVEFTRETLIQIFLNQFLLKEKIQIEESYIETKQELAKLVCGRGELEEELVSFFNNNSSFQDLNLIRKILNVKNMHEEAYNYEIKSRESIETLKRSRDIYKPIAIQAACLFQTVSSMRILNGLYQISINQFFSYISVAINMSDRTGVNTMKQNVLDLIYTVLLKGKFEEDRPLFSLFLALELEDSQGRVSVGDREFLINPRYGALIKQPPPDQDKIEKIPPKSSLKKPFDWMSDEQYNNLLILSQNFDWFTETFEKMPKDGREMQWRQICEHETPEDILLPDNLDERYTPLQRLMVVRAFRSDRLLQAANVFVKTTLGKRFANDTILDLKNIYHQTRPHTPILMYYENDSMFGAQLLDKFATLKQMTLVTYHVSNETFENEKIKKLVCSLSQRSCWLHLSHIQANPYVVNSIIDWLKLKKSDSAFRIWISSDIKNHFPVNFLHSCLHVMVIQPKVLKNALMQSLLMVPGEIWRLMYGSDFHSIVYNLCMLHASLIYREKLALPNNTNDRCGNIQLDRLLESLRIVSGEVKRLIDENVETPSIHQIAYQNIKNLPWQYLRSYIQLFYAATIDKNAVFTSLSALTEYWISVNATKKDFEIPRARYKPPAVLFSSHVKCSSLISAVENMTPFDSNEFTGLFDKEQKSNGALSMFLQLKDLYEKLPGNSSLVHSKKSELFDGKNGIYGVTLHVQEIMEITSNILSKLPRLWSKDFVAERIRRTGGLTSFNLWLLSEADAICELHHVIKSDTTKLQSILSNSYDGNEYSVDVIRTAVDLAQNKIPHVWQERSGPAPPSPNSSLNAWLNDFDARCKHIEKVLILGRERMPGYWLAAFFYPNRLLSVFSQEALQHSTASPGEKTNLISKMEITTRDKDHLRDPPSDGVFLYGVYLWGAHWEKATNELQDLPAKSSPYILPVIHFQTIPRPDKYSVYRCPCYYSRKNTNEEVMRIDIVQKDIPSSRWALRNLVCTLRPF